jgi:hypothetical protein
VAAIAALGLMATPVGVGAEPTATASGEELVRYLTTGKLKPGKRIAYQVVCGADCEVTATTTLVLKGPDVGPVQVAAQFAPQEIAEAFIKPNKAARAAIKADIGASKLRTEVTARNLATGEIDTDTRTFRFK